MFYKLLLTALAVSTLGLAQGSSGMGGADSGMGGMNRGGAGSPQDMGGGGMGGRPSKETPFEIMVSKLKLNKDQQQEAKSILQGTFGDAAQVRQQLGQARGALASALVDGKQDAVNQITKAYAEAETKMIGFEAQAFQKIYAMLKPNQTAHAGEAFEVLAGIFDPAPGAGGAGQRGERRGGGR